MSPPPQRERELGGALPRRREDQRLVRLVTLEDLEQQLFLLTLHDRVKDVAHLIGNAGAAVHPHDLRMQQVAIRDVTHLVGERCREERGLTAHRRATNDGVDVVDEAHVEHPIGFIEHEEAHLPQGQPGRVDEVEDAARCSDDEITAFAQRRFLSGARGSAIRQHGAQPEVLSKALRLTGDLDRQLTRRADHQSLRIRPALAKLLEHRQQERERLAGPGRGDPDQIGAGAEHRKGFFLDRGGGVVAGFVERALHLVAEVEVLEFE